jgi:hypothetical protein
VRALRLVRAEVAVEPVAEPLTSIALDDEIECAVFAGRRWRVICEWDVDGRRMLSLRSENWLIQREDKELFRGNEGRRRV